MVGFHRAHDMSREGIKTVLLSVALCIAFEGSTVRADGYNGVPLHRIIDTNSTIGDARCAPGSLYVVKMSTLVATIPGFVAPTSSSCGTDDFGDPRVASSTLDGCLWKPSEFLGMIYDRCVEEARRGVPFAESWKMYGSFSRGSLEIGAHMFRGDL